MDPDIVVFVVVCALRLLIPLLILRFPLPAIFAALVIDAADQTIFQQMTDLDLEKLNYQGYDKALDIYYLTIAYIATFRNWRAPFAIAVAVFLWYYRLVGVTMFELLDWRPLLLIFPNTFEYYFIFIAAVMVAWDERRLTNKQVITAAAAIWIFIKLPQEYWIHVAQLDFTDFMKDDLMGVDPTSSWGTALGNRPLVTAAIVLLLVVAAVAVVAIRRRLPDADHPSTIDVDELAGVPTPRAGRPEHWYRHLFEKLALLGMITIVFVEAIPTIESGPFTVALSVVVVVVANAAVSHWLAERGTEWSTTARAFGAMVVLNAGLLVVARIVLPGTRSDSGPASTAFFLLLLTLILTLFDRYRRSAEPLEDAEGQPIWRSSAHSGA